MTGRRGGTNMLMYWKNRAVNGVWKLQRRVYEVLRNEDGVGTVEVVLLILGILTPYH